MYVFKRTAVGGTKEYLLGISGEAGSKNFDR